MQVFHSAKHVICNWMQKILEEIVFIRSTGIEYSRSNHTKRLKTCLRNPLSLTFVMLYMFGLYTNWRRLCNDKKKIILKVFKYLGTFFYMYKLHEWFFNKAPQKAPQVTCTGSTDYIDVN